MTTKPVTPEVPENPTPEVPEKAPKAARKAPRKAPKGNPQEPSASASQANGEAKTEPEKPGPLPVVLEDREGTHYLRVRKTAKAAYFVIRKPKSVELIELATDAEEKLGMKALPSSALEVAKLWLTPLAPGTTVDSRAHAELQKVLNNKELIEMNAAKTKSKAETKSAKKAKGAKKATTKTGTRRSQVSLEDRFAVAKKIIGSKKSMTRMEFAAELKKVYPSFYSTTKRLLIEGGYLKVDKDGNISLK